MDFPSRPAEPIKHTLACINDPLVQEFFADLQEQEERELELTPRLTGWVQAEFRGKYERLFEWHTHERVHL